MDDERFAPLIGALTPLGGRRFDPVGTLVLPGLRANDLRFGHRLGLVDASRAVLIETERARRGFPQDEAQEELARTLRADHERADELLGAHPDAVFADVGLRALWLAILLRLLADSWESGRGDPAIDLAELCSGWGDEGACAWRAARPAFADGLRSAGRSRMRMVARAREHADLLLGEVAPGS